MTCRYWNYLHSYVPFRFRFFKDWVLRKTPYIRQGAFPNQDLSEVPFAAPITMLGKNASQVASLDGWPSQIQRQIKYHFQMLESGLLATRNRLCAFVIPDFIARLTNRTCAASEKLVPLKVPNLAQLAPFLVYLVKRKTDSEGVRAKRFARGIRRVLTDQG